jgi:hypothetical protein
MVCVGGRCCACCRPCQGAGDGEVADPLPDWPEPPILKPQSLELSYGDEVPGAGEALKPELSVLPQALVGDPALLLPPLRQGLQVTNGILWPVLARLRQIATEGAPVLSNGDLALWQAEREGVYYQLLLSRGVEDRSQWDYVLQARDSERKDQELVPVLSGFFRPGEGYTDDLQVGEGVLRFHRLTRLKNNLSPRVGVIAFRIHQDGRRDLNVLIEDEDAAINTSLSYSIGPRGGGFFRLGTQVDFLQGEEFPGQERLSQVVGWLPDRSARGAARVFFRPRGQDQTREARVDECWGADLRQVWLQWDPGELGESDGDEGDCAAGLQLMEPRGPEEPEEEPDIP